MSDLTVKELTDKKRELESSIAELLKRFIEETGYAVSGIAVNLHSVQRYHYGEYYVPQYNVKATIDIDSVVSGNVKALMK